MKALSQIDAFFVAYQQSSGVSMQIGVEFELRGDVGEPALRRAIDHLLARWPELGQIARRRRFGGLAWSGTPRADLLHFASSTAACHTWRNQLGDPFSAPPFQILCVPSGDGILLSLRAHHAVCDGQSLMAISAALLGAIAAPPDQPATVAAHFDPFSARAALRAPGSLAARWRYLRWLAAQARNPAIARLAVRGFELGPVAIASGELGAAARADIAATAAAAGTSTPLWVSAAWARALARWNQQHAQPAAPLALEFPISARPASERLSAVGNFISPLLLLAPADQPLPAVAAALRDEVERAARDHLELAVPLFTAAGRYLPWPLFRRLAARPTYSGFATSHVSWLSVPVDLRALVRERSGGALELGPQRLYTPVCLRMGASLCVASWADRLQLFITYRESAISAGDAAQLLGLLCDELGYRAAESGSSSSGFLTSMPQARSVR